MTHAKDMGDADRYLLRRYRAALKRLATRTSTIGRLADWREELEARIWRAEIVQEYSALPQATLDELQIEVQQFTEVARALAENPILDDKGGE